MLRISSQSFQLQNDNNKTSTENLLIMTEFARLIEIEAKQKQQMEMPNRLSRS